MRLTLLLLLAALRRLRAPLKTKGQKKKKKKMSSCCVQRGTGRVSRVWRTDETAPYALQAVATQPPHYRRSVNAHNTNKNPNNLAKGGIATLRLYSPGISSNLQFHAYGSGFDPKSPSPGGQGPPSKTMCHWTPQVYLPNGI